MILCLKVHFAHAERLPQMRNRFSAPADIASARADSRTTVHSGAQCLQKAVSFLQNDLKTGRRSFACMKIVFSFLQNDLKTGRRALSPKAQSAFQKFDALFGSRHSGAQCLQKAQSAFQKFDALFGSRHSGAQCTA